MNIAEILKNVHTIPSPSIGIDFDGTIDEAPVFFNILSNLWPGKVYIITYRDDLPGIKRDLAAFGIKYTDIVTVNSFPQKAQEIDRLGISVFFDDMDEVLKHVKSNVTVLKIRNEGNFDYDDKRWVYSEDTGRQI